MSKLGSLVVATWVALSLSSAALAYALATSGQIRWAAITAT